MKTDFQLTKYPREGGGAILTNLALLPRCHLKKMKSDDGRWEFVEGKTFVGKEYIYSPISRRTTTIKYLPTQTERECEIVFVYDERGIFCMMPTECLEFPATAPHHHG